MSRFLLFGKTDQGLRRKKNEDTILVNEAGGFCLVADGIGGTAAGEIASRLFARTTQDIFSAAPDTEEMKYQSVQHAFSAANDRILDYAEGHPGCEGMGCTAELLVLADSSFIIGHIGDSRTYRLRNGELKQLTTDHTLVQEQLDQGLINQEEASHHSFKNVILRAVGIKKNPALDILRGKTFPGDLFLLCSDGLTDMIEDGVIKAHLMARISLEERINHLIQEANARGGKDNISAVIAEIV